MAVYLLHFDTPYKHARHYIGFAADANLNKRIAHHRDGSGARLMQVVAQAGIDFVLARVWPGKDKTFERRLKNCKNSAHYCPICNPEKAPTNTLARERKPHV